MPKPVCVIICTYERPALLKQVLESLVKQSASRDLFSVLVVDNNSRENIQRAVDLFVGRLDIRYCREARQGLSWARNKGVKECNGEYVSFLDDDAIADPLWIDKAVKIIKTEGPDIFGGSIKPFYNTIKTAWLKDEYNSLTYQDKIILGDDKFLWASNLFIKRSLFDKVGEFDVTLGMVGNSIGLGEETDWQNKARDAGYKILYFPELAVCHLVGAEKMGLGYMSRRYLRSSTQEYLIRGELSWLTVMIKIPRLIAEIVALAVLYPFRDRIRFPFWQNYFYERMLHRLGSLNWCRLSLLEKINAK